MSSPIKINFGSAAKFAPAMRLVGSLEGLLGGLNSRWRFRYDLPSAYRKAPKTLKPRAGPAPAQQTITEVIARFAEKRDMFALTDPLMQAMGQAVFDRTLGAVLAGGAVPNAGALMLSLASEYKKAIVHRWENGGFDLHLTPLSPDYVRYKTRLGYPAAIGRFTGQSLAALKKARVSAVKV